ncbi:MAG: hypothetical protein COA97_01425 [Flavobacteriales bacterium]|nr:MAG: hypothetical protein COA97_01425 [Flavobacteriales bacterium]
MKTKFSYIILFLLIAFISTAAIQIAKECDATALKKELKRELRPDYKYDSSKTSRFTYKTKVQAKEIEVPLFMGEKYRFLFNTAGLPQNIKIEIYNKKIGHKKRKLLYTLEQKQDQHIYIYEPKKSRRMYINYTIPESTETELKGCMIFVLGYRLAVLKSLLD